MTVTENTSIPENLSQCQSVRQKTHVDRPNTKSGYPVWQTVYLWTLQLADAATLLRGQQLKYNMTTDGEHAYCPNQK